MVIYRILTAIVLIPLSILTCLTLIFTVDKLIDELHKRVMARRRTPAARGPRSRRTISNPAPMAGVGADKADRA